MASITITINDADAQNVLNALAYTFGYQDTIDGQPNPQTKLQFIRQRVIGEWKEMTQNYLLQLSIPARPPAPDIS